MKHLKPILAAALLTLAGCGRQASGELALENGWARETTTGVTMSAAYGRLSNGTGLPVRLVGGETAAAERVEIHNVTMDNGVMRMRPVEGGLEVAAGGSVDLRPGSYHVMLVGLRRPLRAGEQLPLTLRFEGHEPVQVSLPVRTAAQGGGS